MILILFKIYPSSMSLGHRPSFNDTSDPDVSEFDAHPWQQQFMFVPCQDQYNFHLSLIIKCMNDLLMFLHHISWMKLITLYV